MSTGRVIGLGVCGLALLGAAVGCGARDDRGQATGAEPADSLRSRPHVYYRSVRPGEYGKVVLADLDAPDERRAVSDLTCDRLDFGVRRGLCLAEVRGVPGIASIVKIVDVNFAVLKAFPMTGAPIRARVSPDERYGAVTVFATGEHYDADFTTRTWLVDLERQSLLGELESFDTTRDGTPFREVDFNFWGVTFERDPNRFYATLGTGARRFLVRGTMDSKQFETVRDGMECPSLSPDGSRVGFKKPNANAAVGSRTWRVAVFDLASQREWLLPQETRNIDDQVEWLDDDHLLYQFAEPQGLPEEAVNTWVSPVERESAPPRIFIKAGTSPAVVRP
ncbi:MAG: hypothetical protein U0Q55_07520 [Vicinamibacterales bacterium]